MEMYGIAIYHVQQGEDLGLVLLTSLVSKICSIRNWKHQIKKGFLCLFPNPIFPTPTCAGNVKLRMNFEQPY